MSALGILRAEIGPCREWPLFGERCNKPAEYVLWGKLFPQEALGPRCYDCAARHVGEHGLAWDSTYAVIHIGRLAKNLQDAMDERYDDGWQDAVDYLHHGKR